MKEEKYSWERIAAPFELEEMPVNSVKGVEADGKYYCIGRLADGYYVIDDKCPHAGGHFSDGWCDERGRAVCPHHRYSFSFKTGKGPTGYYVENYPIEVKEDGLYIGKRKKKWWQLF